MVRSVFDDAATGPDPPLPPRWWWAGLTERERLGRSPSDRPGWAAFVRDALGRAPTAPPPRERIPGDLSALAVPPRPFVTVAADRLEEAIAPLAGPAALDPAGLLRCFTDQLSTKLAGATARTLVRELNVARKNGRLAGHTGRDRFADYIATTATAPRLAALLATYPVLARLIAERARQTVDATTEMLTRFAADRPAIIDRLLDGTDPGPLSGMELGAGDAHADGRSVTLLRFATGAEVAYKPRPVAMLARFADLVGWLNTVVPSLDLYAVPALTRTGYGWSRFVPHRPCADASGVSTFYRRQGALLALLYATDGIDAHFENIIANADQPVLVDAETLFHPTFAAEGVTGTDPAMVALASSVDRTGLLPVMLLGEDSALDVSGLGGGEAAVSPIDQVAWADIGTDTMRLVRRQAALTAGVNRPRTGGVDADPFEHHAALLSGFRAAYAAIVARRAEFVDLLSRFADDAARIVARPTMVYARLLDESTHPDLLRDAEVRDALFRRLGERPAADLARGLLPSELAALWAGDVPMFTTCPASRDVWAPGGDRVPDALAESGLTAAAAKVARMGEADRRDQEWVIAAAYASRVGTVDHTGADLVPGVAGPAVFASRVGTVDHGGADLVPASAGPAAVDPGRTLALAVEVGDEIVARARWDGARASWLGLEPLDGRYWRVLPMGAGLADGYCGVALFLAQLAATTGAETYAETALAAISPLPRLLGALAATPESVRAVGPGGFHGLGGICYALARIGTLLGDPIPWLDDAVRLVGALVDDGPDDSVATGRAGALAAMVAVRAETGSPLAARLAAQFAERVRDAAPPGDGFLWGRSGVDWALRRYTGTGPDPVRPRWSPGDAPNHGWCHGVAGVAAAGHDGSTPPWLATWLDLAGDSAPLADASPCHGELGILEALAVLGTGDERARSAHRRRAAAFVDSVARHGPRCGTPNAVPSPGLLTGLSGIGYGLLRLAGPVPSVLLLEGSPATGQGTAPTPGSGR